MLRRALPADAVLVDAPAPKKFKFLVGPPKASIDLDESEAIRDESNLFPAHGSEAESMKQRPDASHLSESSSDIELVAVLGTAARAPPPSPPPLGLTSVAEPLSPPLPEAPAAAERAAPLEKGGVWLYEGMEIGRIQGPFGSRLSLKVRAGTSM